MNATRAATIRLRSSFDGAVSLGRVQTPTLAIVARREEEIRAFKPEPYWLVDATFAADRRSCRARTANGERIYVGHFQAPAGSPGTTKGPRIGTEEEAQAIVAACEGRPGTITKLEKKEQREKAPMLYDLTTLQREANNRYGFSAKRTLGGRAAALRGAQGAHLSAHQLALPDDRHGRGDQADRRARGRAQRVPQGRRVRGRPRRAAARSAWSTTRRSPTTTRSSPRARSTTSRKWAPTTGASTTWRCGASWRCSTPRRCSRTRASRRPSGSPHRPRRATAARTPTGHVFRTRGKLLIVPGWRGVYDEVSADAKAAEAEARGEEDEETEQQLPRLLADEQVQTRRSRARARKPNRRGATATRRCSARWRRPASWSTTTSCARR